MTPATPTAPGSITVDDSAAVRRWRTIALAMLVALCAATAALVGMGLLVEDASDNVEHATEVVDFALQVTRNNDDIKRYMIDVEQSFACVDRADGWTVCVMRGER